MLNFFLRTVLAAVPLCVCLKGRLYLAPHISIGSVIVTFKLAINTGFCPQWSAMVGPNQYLVLTDHSSHLHNHHYILVRRATCFIPKLHFSTQSGNKIGNHVPRSWQHPVSASCVVSWLGMRLSLVLPCKQLRKKRGRSSLGRQWTSGALQTVGEAQ